MNVSIVAAIFYLPGQQRYYNTKLKYLADSHRPVEQIGLPPLRRMNMSEINKVLDRAYTLHNSDLDRMVTDTEVESDAKEPNATETLPVEDTVLFPIYSTLIDGKRREANEGCKYFW